MLFSVFFLSSFSYAISRSMSAVEFSSYSNKRDSLASISSAFDYRQFTPSSKNTVNEFLGLSLPLDLSRLFQVRTIGFGVYCFTGYFSVLTVLKSQILSSYFVTAFIEDKLNIFLTKQKQVIQISLELVRRASSVCGKLSL